MEVQGLEITGSKTSLVESIVEVGSLQDAEVYTADFTASVGQVHIMSSSAVINAALPTNATAGDSVKFSNLTAQENVIDRNGHNIMNLAENMTLDTTTAHFEMVYGDSTTGWVIIA